MNSNVLNLQIGKASEQVMVDYVNAVSEVSGYAYGLIKTRLPVLRDPFPTYAEYVDKFGVACSHMLIWTDSLLSNFHGVPASVVNLNSMLRSQLSTLIQLLTELKVAPQSPELSTEINSQFTALQSELQRALNAVTALVADIDEFAATIGSDAEMLQQLADAAEEAEDGDRAQIQKLQDVVAEIQDTISAMNERMTLEKFGQWDMKILLVAAGITSGLIVGGPAGSIAVGLLGATVTTFVPIGGTVISQEDVDRLQGQMDRVSEEIGALNTDIGLLQSVAIEFSAMTPEASSELLEDLNQVKALWQDLGGDIQAVVEQLNTAMSEWTTSEGIDKAITDLTQVGGDWEQIEAAASTLSQIQYDFDPEVKTAA